MENQGYEEESSTRQPPRINSKYSEKSSSAEKPRCPPIERAIKIEPSVVVNPFRNDPESHVYEDIGVSENSKDIEKANNPSSLPSVDSPGDDRTCQRSENSRWPTKEDFEDENVRNATPLCSLESANGNNPGNFHRNLTLPVRRTIGSCASDGSAARFSVRVTNRERTRFSNGQNDSSLYGSATDSLGIEEEHSGSQENDGTREMSQIVEKPGGRRRRKKDCKHCKNKINSINSAPGFRENLESLKLSRNPKDSSSIIDISGATIPSDKNERMENDRRSRLDFQAIFALSDGKLPLFNAQSSNFHSNVSNELDNRKNSLFSLSNNVNSVFNGGGPKNLNYDKNETEVRLVSVEQLTDERALITPSKNRTGMKVNSIYSQEQWRSKDLPIFVTDVKEQTFQRAYSLPTRTQTPSSQNRLNLRRSVRGEPPPNPARLRKNRHGWTLHFARPLDGTGCTRSIVLLLIAILALLGIGGIALYIVFEPEQLQIIQQYLRSSTPNITRETNSTFTADSLNFQTNTLTDGLGMLPQETTLPTETESDLAITTVEIPMEKNSTRHCDDCYDGEVCVALVDEEVPICRIGPDPLDPTGCNGLCLINKQKCHRLDLDAFRCVEVEHYCLDDEWTCSNTLCIPLVKHCDGHMNCYDHSDEYDCVCDLQTHFQCGNETSCLPLERRCDGKIDCWDASDEINCTLACPSSTEFTCSNGECIPKARFCDRLRDCTDGSDEPRGCQGRCIKHEFSCLNGRCVTKGMKCNGIDDCGDESDEQHCRDRVFVKPVT